MGYDKLIKNYNEGIEMLSETAAQTGDPEELKALTPLIEAARYNRYIEEMDDDEIA